ncbi:UTP8 [[Candida] subhashii]|uniref:UTP8 n=1 Tax=[Candida] subhashii TaxID=561895 RepID=A0A8J5QHK0_9ASCO|nr:UTP8 [[Candida] subhashii]KAG7664776.1 UTP8 [[Candida] subhashii]
MTSPGLYDQYPITTLPRIPDIPLNSKLITPPQGISNTSTIIDFAISKSSIASHVIKPSPRLLWSFTLSPTTIVDCMDVKKIDNEQKKLYVVGKTDRGSKFKLLMIETDQDINTVGDVELELKERVVGVKFYNEDLIVVVYESGSIEYVKYGFQSLEFAEVKYVVDDGRKVIYSHFVEDLHEKFVVTVGKSSNGLKYSLVSIASSQILEVNSFVKDSIPEDITFSYISGVLYQYCDSQIIATSIVNFQSVSTTNVASLISDKSLVSIEAVAPDRILLGSGNKIHLINIKYSALLSTLESSPNANVPDKVYLDNVVTVKGNSQNTMQSKAIYLNLRNKNNNVYVNIIDLNVGLNKLVECLGKSISQPSHELTDIVELYNIDEAANVATQEIQEVYQELKPAQESQDLNKWESILIPYLKNKKPWTAIKKASMKSKPTSKVYQFKEFDVDNDRIIDINFISSVLDLIFTIEANDKLKFRNESFIPEYTLMYLFTNPIYPIKFTFGLLELLYKIENLTLLRQAISTCPNIPCGDYLNQLIINEDEDLLHDLINRIIQEFSRIEIIDNFKQIVQIMDVNLIELINKLIKLNGTTAWLLIEMVIDIAGLFNWSGENIDDLNEIITKKINSLMINSYNLTLINQVLSNSTIQKKKNKKQNQLQELSIQQTQLDSMLLNKPQQQVIQDDDDDLGIEISQRIPNYSIEKLTL